MSGNKQIALVAGLIVMAGMALQAGIPRLANDTGLLYLRAQYKLATGDTGSALQLMQRAAAASSQPEAPKTSPAVVSCSNTRPKPVAQAKKSAPAPHVASIRMAKDHQVHFVPPVFPRSWSANHERVLAQLQARQAMNEVEVRAIMARVQAQLKDLPVSMPAIAVPTSPVSLP